jgi:hypothetical protein
MVYMQYVLRSNREGREPGCMPQTTACVSIITIEEQLIYQQLAFAMLNAIRSSQL